MSGSEIFVLAYDDDTPEIDPDFGYFKTYEEAQAVANAAQAGPIREYELLLEAHKEKLSKWEEEEAKANRMGYRNTARRPIWYRESPIRLRPYKIEPGRQDTK